MKRTLLLLVIFLFCPSAFAENLLPDPDLIHGVNGIFVGDGISNYFAPVCREDNALCITLDGQHYTGVFLPEVPYFPNCEYMIRFKAKAARPTSVMVSEYITRENGSYGVRQPPLTTEYRTFEYRFNTDGTAPWKTKRFGANDPERFGGFRVVALPKKMDTGNKIYLKDFYFGPSAHPEKKSPPHCTGTLVGWGKPYTRYNRGETIQQTLEINNPFPVLRKSNCILTLDDGRGFRKEFDFPVNLKPGMNTFTLPVRLPYRNGIFSLTGTVEGTPFLRNTSYTIFPEAKVRPGDLPIDLGINGVGRNTGDLLEPAVSACSQIGITCIRPWDTGNYFRWSVFEPEPGRFDWQECDRMVVIAAKHGISVMPVIGGVFLERNPGTNPMHLKKNGRVSILPKSSRTAICPSDSDWRRMIRAMARRYKGKIHSYEIINEPNIFLPKAEEYMPYLRSAYEELKKEDPSCTVVGVCVTGDFNHHILSYVGQALRLGAADYMDVMSFHSYNNLYEENLNSGETVMNGIRARMTQQGKTRPLWHTELYYLNPYSTGGGDGLYGSIFHPGWLVRRLILDAAHQVGYGMLLHASSYFGSVSNFHYRQERARAFFFSPVRMFRETAVVSAVFANTLQDTKFAGRVIDNNGYLCGYLFSGKNKAVAVCFTPAAPEKSEGYVKIPAQTTDVFGNPVPGIAISALPTYVVAANTAAISRALENYGRCDFRVVAPKDLKVAKIQVPSSPRIDVDGIQHKIRVTPANRNVFGALKGLQAGWLKKNKSYAVVSTAESPILDENWRYISFTFKPEDSGIVTVSLMGQWNAKVQNRKKVLYSSIFVNGKALSTPLRLCGSAKRIPSAGKDGKEDAYLVDHDNPVSFSVQVEAGKICEIEVMARSAIGFE